MDAGTLKVGARCCRYHNPKSMLAKVRTCSDEQPLHVHFKCINDLQQKELPVDSIPATGQDSRNGKESVRNHHDYPHYTSGVQSQRQVTYSTDGTRVVQSARRMDASRG